jgi:archaetidylinositol phosphate synthase
MVHVIKEKCQGWQVISSNIGAVFSQLPFHPNVYSVLTLIPAFLAVPAVIYHHYYLATGLFLLAGFLDIVDGGVARQRGISSHFGAFLDGSLDRFVDFAVIFSYFWLPISPPLMTLSYWIALAVFVAIMPSFEVAYANHRCAVKDPHETKIWRILNRGEMYPLMLLVIFTAAFNPSVSGWILATWVSLSVLTTLQTLFLALYLSYQEG